MKKKRFRGTAGLLLLASGSLPSRAELYRSTDVGTHALTTPSYAVHQGAGSLGHHHHLEAPENEFEFELMLGADSRYVSEGRGQSAWTTLLPVPGRLKLVPGDQPILLPLRQEQIIV